MAKKKTKKSERKRVLTYGKPTSAFVKKDKTSEESNFDVVKTASSAPENETFKKELRKNLVFVFSFFMALFVLYFILTRTNILNPLLNIVGLDGLYR